VLLVEHAAPQRGELAETAKTPHLIDELPRLMARTSSEASVRAPRPDPHHDGLRSAVSQAGADGAGSRSQVAVGRDQPRRMATTRIPKHSAAPAIVVAVGGR
jgi:hypothetical protein